MENTNNGENNQGHNVAGIFFIVILIGFFSATTLPDTNDFSAKYASKYDVRRSDVSRYVTSKIHSLPIPYNEYVIQYENGTDETVGYGILGMVFIKSKIRILTF